MAALIASLPLAAGAGNCLVRGNVKIGDCEGVTIGARKNLTISRSGTHSGNFGQVLIRTGATVDLSGNVDRVVVERGAHLSFSGNADKIEVHGSADINGNVESVVVSAGADATIRGITSYVKGAGRITKARGAIIGGVYVRE